jgi:hypothetical protein
MYTKETFGLWMRHITFLLYNAAEAELREGIGSTGNVTLLAEKSFWRNSFFASFWFRNVKPLHTSKSGF